MHATQADEHKSGMPELDLVLVRSACDFDAS